MASHIDKQILTAAIAEFARAGYCGTTTKEIAKIAEVEERSLFRIFKSKDNLFDEAVRAAIANVQPRAAEIEFILTRDRSEKGLRSAVRRLCEILDSEFVRLYAFTVLERGASSSFTSCIDIFGREFERALPWASVEKLLDYCLGARIFRHASSRAKHLAAVDSFVQMLLKSVEKPVPRSHRTR